MQAADDDPERRARLERLVRTLDRIRMRTEYERELLRALVEAERLGAQRERSRCAAWMEAVVTGDDGAELAVRELARALRQSGYG